MVKVRVNGKMEVLSCTLSEEALKLNDGELLEDLITAAVNQALEKVRRQVAEETGKMATGLGVPGRRGQGVGHGYGARGTCTANQYVLEPRRRLQSRRPTDCRGRFRWRAPRVPA